MSLTNLPWQTLTIISALLLSLSLMLNKRQAVNASSLQVRAYYYFFAAVQVSIWWWLTSATIPSNWWLYYLYGMALGIVVVVYTMAQRISMSKTSLVAPIGQLLGIVLAAVFLSEWRLLTSQQGQQLMIALVLMPLLFWLLFEKGENSKKWLKLSIFHLLSLAVFKVIIKLLLDAGGVVVQILLFQYFGSLTIIILGILIRKQKFLVSKKFALRGLIHGLIGSTAILTLYLALKLASVTQTTLIRTPLILLLTTMGGLIGFKEIKQMTTKKWLGAIVAVVILFLVITAGS